MMISAVIRNADEAVVCVEWCVGCVLLCDFLCDRVEDATQFAMFDVGCAIYGLQTSGSSISVEL